MTPGNATLRQPGAAVAAVLEQLRGIAPDSSVGPARTAPALPAGMLELLVASVLSSTPCPPGEALEGGAHRRLEMSRGAVHLWCRGEFDSVVFYVHGYRDTVDSAFSNHRLAAQFAASKKAALFIAVAGPSGPRMKVVFEDLDALVNELSATLQLPIPEETTLVGHSGGNRTLRAWLSSSRASDVVLLDGLYGDPAPWTKWLNARPDASLRMVGEHTWQRADRWRSELPRTLRARASLVAANASHMQIVTAGEWIPAMVAARASR